MGSSPHVPDSGESSATPAEQERPLTLIAAIALVVANMIGVGIFTSTGFQAGDLGGAVPSLIAWGVGGVLALCGAAVYGELGAMMPRAGGEYVYLSEAYAPVVGFLSGWVSLIVGFSAPIAAAAFAFGFYTHVVVPDVPTKVAGVGLIVGVTAMHTVSVAFGAKLQTWFSSLKAILILVLIIAGLTVGEGSWSNLSAGKGAEMVTTGAFASSLVWVSFAYSGWNAAAYVAGEIKNPGRNLPLALLIGTAIVTSLYILLNVVFFYAAPASELAGIKEVGAFASIKMFGKTAGTLLSALIAFALVSSVSAMIMAGPRVYMAMAEDGYFFKVFAQKTTRGAPVWSVLLQGSLAVVLLLIAKFDQLINYIGFTLAIFAALTVAGAFVLRVRRPDAPRPYKTFGWPVTPVLFIGLSVWMAYFLIKMRPDESLAGGITLVAGGVVFLAWDRLRKGA
jgi:APA family basic amino acid/polyamine antiporter